MARCLSMASPSRLTLLISLAFHSGERARPWVWGARSSSTLLCTVTSRRCSGTETVGANAELFWSTSISYFQFSSAAYHRPPFILLFVFQMFCCLLPNGTRCAGAETGPRWRSLTSTKRTRVSTLCVSPLSLDMRLTQPISLSEVSVLTAGNLICEITQIATLCFRKHFEDVGGMSSDKWHCQNTSP